MAAKNELGVTALIHAGCHDYADIAQLLMGDGANMESEDKDG